jgi:hypothetical protein
VGRIGTASQSHQFGRRGGRARVHAFAIDPSTRRFYTRPGEPVAQMVEHLTFNQVVLGSSPSGLTKRVVFLDKRAV